MSVNQRVYADPFSQFEQPTDMLGDRWLASVSVPIRVHADAAALDAFLGSFRGINNTVGLWHFVRPVPRGTLRGAPVLAALAAQFASSIQVTVPAATTILAGDVVGLGGQLLMAAANATAVGTTLTIPLVNRLRKAQSASAAVTWNKPTAQFRLLMNPGVRYMPGYAEGVSLEFGEAIL